MIETSILMNSIINDPNRLGEPATRKVYFGDRSRFSIMAIHTRFDRIEWIIRDAEHPDSTMQEAVIIIQEENAYTALARYERWYFKDNS